MSQVKLIDVAKKAGVSKSTASQFLNGRYEYMSDATRKRLETTVEELGFVPNQLARSLKTKKTNTIGVMVNSINGPTTSSVIRGIDDHLKKQGYNVLIYNTDYNKATELTALSSLESLSADGLIITSSGLISPLLNDETKLGMPVVHIHRTFADLKANTVLSDFHDGAYQGTDYLIQLGHQRIAIITRAYDQIPSRQLRVDGYLKALTDNALSIDSALIHIANNEQEAGPIVEKLMALPNPPTAIFTMYAKITKGLLYHCNNNAIDIPNDLSVIGFDDLPMATLFKTPLTVVNQSSYDLGVESAKLLLNKIIHPDVPQVDVVLPCHLIIRDSCKQTHTS